MPTVTSSHGDVTYRVGDLVVDATRRCVTRRDDEIPLTPLSFELLLALTRAAPEVMSMDQLMRQVWRGSVVSNETVSQRVKLVRDALGDEAASPRYIAGVRGRGYRMVAPVTSVTAIAPSQSIGVDRSEPQAVTPHHSPRHNVLIAVGVSCTILVTAALWWVGHGTGHPAPPAGVTARAISPQSVAVMPFANLSPDKNNSYLASGIQELVLTRLDEIGGLTVIARTSTQDYQSHPGNLKAIGHTLGVASILEGSVQRAGDQVLINVQLIDPRNAHHLWAQSYQRSLKNIFGVEGEVAQSVAVALKTRLGPAEKSRVMEVPTHDPAAYDAYLRGITLSNSKDAIISLRRAVRLDPHFALAWAALSNDLSSDYFNAYDFRPATLTEAKRALDQALALAPNAPETQMARASYLVGGLREYESALAAYHKVLDVSPNNAGALAAIGIINRRQGHWQTAIAYFKQCLALDPRGAATWGHLGWSYQGLHQYAKAEEMYRRDLAIRPDDLFTIRSLITLYQSKGELAKASKLLARVKLSPGRLLLYMPVVNQALYTRHYRHAIAILEKAIATPHLADEPKGAYYQYLGFAEELEGDTRAARRAYRQAVLMLQHAPDSPLTLAMLGLAQAGLGHNEAALASGRRSMSLIPATRDHFQGPIAQYYFAVIEAQVGEKTQAIGILGQLLRAAPGSDVCEFLTPALLRLNPFWNPLRTEPGFRALLAEFPTVHKTGS